MTKPTSHRNNDTMENPDRIPHFSVIIPVYNEEENIPALYSRLTVVMEACCNEERVPIHCYEIILIDDCSTDRSWQIIKDISTKDPRVRGISFSKNYGQHPAIIAGIERARGNVLTIMDADLQAQPEDIPKAIEKIRQGSNIVWAVSEDREDSLIVKFGAKVFYFLMNRIASIKMPENTVFTCFDRTAAKAIRLFRETKRLPGGVYSDIGFKRETVKVEKKRRLHGNVKYDFFMRFKLVIKGIFTYSKTPLRFVTALGLIMASFSFIWGLYIFLKKTIWDIPVSGYTSLFIVVTLLSGVQLISLGVIAEYLGIVFDEVKQRPMYIVSETTDTEGRHGFSDWQKTG